MSFPADQPGEQPSQPPDPAPVAASVVRFCRDCGRPWQLDWLECPHCAARRGNAVAPEEAMAQLRGDMRRVKSAVGLYFALLSISIVSIIVLLSRGGENHQSEDVLMAASAVMAVITLIWCIASWRDVLPVLKRPPSPLWLLVGAAAAIPTVLIAHSAVELIDYIVGAEKLDYLKHFMSEGYTFGVAVIAICVQPAIFEELAFRGIILSALDPVIGARQAVVVSALMFAILHLSIPSIPHLFVLGLVLAWLRLKTGSLYAGMACHFMHNFLVLLAEQHPRLLPW